ncbi:MAG: hypothetical protein EP330_12810 [Deltaproteobacteria bacterium]|nr:MAG: hypothetical protein EP330_12810 [Deltaproteobacteria bacterium]
MTPRLTPLLALLALSACKKDDQDTGTLPPCYVDEVPPEAQRRFGPQEDGSFISFGGRLIQPAGPTVNIANMPIDLAVHPDASTAYIVTVDRGDTSIQVLDLDTLTVSQTLQTGHLNHGIVVDAAGTTLYAAGGAAEQIYVFDIAIDGSLTVGTNIPVSGSRIAGLALSADGGTLYAASFTRTEAYEIDTATGAVLRTFDTSTNGWDVELLPTRNELYISDLDGTELSVVDLASGTETAVIPVPVSPAGMAVSADEATVFVAVSNGDRVAAVDTATASVRAEADVTEHDLLDADGLPLGNSNINAVWLDGDRLYASRGSDNAVSVLDAATLEVLGAIPTAEYPTELQVVGDTLVVAAYTGSGEQSGAVSAIDLAGLDLALSAEDVASLYASPTERFPFSCDDGFFPIPTSPEQVSPIEHVVLVVKENKTMDCLFGDMVHPGLTLDPASQRWPSELTPNQRQLIRSFNSADNFYVDTRESDSGHVMLTSTHLTHWVEFQWVETSRVGASLAWPLSDMAMPTTGNFFTHLHEHGKSLAIYGEIVGVSAEASDGTRMAEYTDTDYPGGPAINYAVPDEEKAAYIVEEWLDDGLADFTFVSFPNDHTNGTGSGDPTPESMIADNDRAVGVLIEGLSTSEYWEKSLVIVLQDDPQGCGDHVNDSRSPLFVVSPWAKRGGYVSPTTSNFLSVFATIERILAVPPMGRPDAAAVPLWDFFTPDADFSPVMAVDRVPPETNAVDALGADEKWDLAGPDRDPRYAAFLDIYGRYRMGFISREEAEAAMRLPHMDKDEEEWEELEEESEEDSFAYDRDLQWYREWSRGR